MNYRHAYHAGNFADVLKHAVLARVLAHLGAKPTPYRVLDTHAGIGRYDLASDEAAKTGEWRDGVGRLHGVALEPPLAAFLAPWLDVIAAENPDGNLAVYPGSPVVARRMLRPGDGLMATELHPEDARTLAATFAGDRQARVVELDGWLALKSFLPFKERRGLVVVDPPFEAVDEFDRLIAGLREAHRRAPGVVFLVWYPIKDRRAVARFHAASVALGIRKQLRVELAVAADDALPGLVATGLLVVNPPYTLKDELAAALPLLARRLARAPGGGSRVDWLVPE